VESIEKRRRWDVSKKGNGVIATIEKEESIFFRKTKKGAVGARPALAKKKGRRN